MRRPVPVDGGVSRNPLPGAGAFDAPSSVAFYLRRLLRVRKEALAICGGRTRLMNEGSTRLMNEGSTRLGSEIRRNPSAGFFNRSSWGPPRRGHCFCPLSRGVGGLFPALRARANQFAQLVAQGWIPERNRRIFSHGGASPVCRMTGLWTTLFQQDAPPSSIQLIHNF